MPNPSIADKTEEILKRTHELKMLMQGDLRVLPTACDEISKLLTHAAADLRWLRVEFDYIKRKFEKIVISEKVEPFKIHIPKVPGTVFCEMCDSSVETDSEEYEKDWGNCWDTPMQESRIYFCKEHK